MEKKSSTEQLNKNGRPQGMHPNSQRNLEKRKSWEPGESGNHQGQSLKAILTEELLDVPTIEADGFDGKGRTNARLMIRKAVLDARSGDRYARAEIWERQEGKVTQPIAGPDGEPVATFILVMTDGSKRTAKELAEGD